MLLGIGKHVYDCMDVLIAAPNEELMRPIS